MQHITGGETEEANGTRRICGTSRSGRVCISLTPCNGCKTGVVDEPVESDEPEIPE